MRVLVRLYRVSLLALPRAFRDRYASEMQDVFGQRLAEASGFAAMIRRTSIEIADVVGTGLRLRAASLSLRTRRSRQQRQGASWVQVASGFRGDLRGIARGLRRRPGYALTAVLTVAMGIGSAIAIFGVLDVVLLRPLPYPDSDRLVMAWRVVERYGFQRAPVSYPDFVDWREGTRSFEELAAYAVAGATLLEAGEPERLLGARVTGDLFPALRVNPGAGRLIGRADVDPTQEPVVVLSYALWQRRFGGDPAVLGRTISLGGERPRVVGVAPEGFDFPSARVDYWIPLRMDPATAERDMNFLHVVGRLRAGVPLKAAESDLRSVVRQVAMAHPGENEVDDAWLESRHAYVVGDTRPVLLLVAGAVGLLLALACANLINLLLVRASARERELAIRAALGAARGRLAWPLLSESLALATLGGLLGVGLAHLLIRLVLTLEPGALPHRAEIGLDVRVLGFAVALTLACGFLCGLLPALRAGRRAPAARLREGGGALGGGRSARLQVGLAVAQVALAMVLLVGAGLLGHSLYRLLSVSTGFEGERVLTAHIALPEERYAEGDQVDRFYEQLLARLEGVAGVEAVGATWALPFSSAYASSDFAPADAEDPQASRTIVLAPIRGDFFRALGMTLLRGRGFSPGDGPESPPVAVVNQTLARIFWPGEDAVGKRLRGSDPEGSKEIIVVGVVVDVKRSGLDVETQPEAYLPQRQASWATDMYITVRASGDPRALTPVLRGGVLELDPTLPVTGVMTLAERVSESVASPRFRAAILGALAVGAALVALIGIYGVLSFVVAQRQREMAVRLAVGARRAQVLSEVLAGGLRITLGGLALGTAGALLSGRALRAFLFEVDAVDPLTFIGVMALFLVAATMAAYMPARRAAAADPMVTLRQG